MYKLTDCQYGVTYFFTFLFWLVWIIDGLRVEDCPKEVHQIKSFTFYEILGLEILHVLEGPFQKTWCLEIKADLGDKDWCIQ